MSRKQVFAYYNVPAALRAASQVLQLNPWPEWPHVYLANMGLDDDSLRAFSNNFGTLHANKPVTKKAIRRAQAALRKEWQRAMAAPKPGMPGPSGWTLAQDLKGDFALRMTPDGTVEIIARDLWEFAHLAFLHDFAMGRTLVCQNPSCKMP